MSNSSRVSPTRWRLADLLLDTKRQRVWRGLREIRLPKLSYNLLVALVRNSPEVICDDELMQDVWPGLIVSPETVSQRVKLLREALGDDSRMPRYIGRLRGRGYYLIAAVEPLSDETAAAPAPLSRPAPPAVEAIAFEPDTVLDPIGELTLLEGPQERQTLKEPDWVSPVPIPTQLFAALLDTSAAASQDEPDSADPGPSAPMETGWPSARRGR